MNSKDFYPYSIKDLAVRCGASIPSVCKYLKRINLTQVEETYIGTARYFSKDVLDRLIAAGCGKRHRSPNGTSVSSRTPKFDTPMGIVVTEDNVPLPTASGMEKYPFHALQPGQSFVLYGITSKHMLAKACTEAGKKLGGKFIRRYEKGPQTLRVWRTE